MKKWLTYKDGVRHIFLPTGDFHEIEFMKKNKAATATFECFQTIIEKKLLESIWRAPDNDKGGHFLECDLEYPFKIFEKTKTTHLLPVKTQ